MARVEESQRIKGLYLVVPEKWPDDRGVRTEMFRREWIQGANEMVVSSLIESKPGVLRGMHYHLFQADFVVAVAGRTFAAFHDLRESSPTRRAVDTVEFDAGAGFGVYVPPGVAHGYWALTNGSIAELADQPHDGSDDFGIAWDDPALGITWPGDSPTVSRRDRTNPRLAAVPEENRPG